MTTSTPPSAPSRWERLRDSFLWYSFKRDRTAQLCLAVFICLVVAAFAAPLLAPTDPYDLRQIDIMSSELPPFWIDGADDRYTLGTDAQGRDLWSIILYGTRVSLLIGFGFRLTVPACMTNAERTSDSTKDDNHQPRDNFEAHCCGSFSLSALSFNAG